MREIKELLVSKINELIDNGTVDRVIGWKAGEFCYDVSRRPRDRLEGR